jgi:iron complex transport system substrate-binding protein
LLRAFLAALALSGVFGGCRAERLAPGSHPPRPDVPVRPSRVVTLAPNLTEIVFALGAGDTLVGVSEYSDYPEAARAIPRVGGLEVDPERVAALSPDLVLAIAEGQGRAAVGALEAAGVPVGVVPSGSLDAVLEAIGIVGTRLGRVEEAKALAASLEAKREKVRRRPDGAAARRPRGLLLVWPDPPQAAGGGTFLDDVLTEAGAENAAGNLRGWPMLSKEYLATADIDVLVIPDSAETRPAYAKAFESGPLSRGPVARAKVVRLDEAALTRPGPRVFDALDRLSQDLR